MEGPPRPIFRNFRPYFFMCSALVTQTGAPRVSSLHVFISRSYGEGGLGVAALAAYCNPVCLSSFCFVFTQSSRGVN